MYVFARGVKSASRNLARGAHCHAVCGVGLQNNLWIPTVVLVVAGVGGVTILLNMQHRIPAGIAHCDVGLMSRAIVQHYRSVLESAGLAPPSINLRLSAIRKLAAEAAENDLLDRSVAQGIVFLKGVGQSGDRAGNGLHPGTGARPACSAGDRDPSLNTSRARWFSWAHRLDWIAFRFIARRINVPFPGGLSKLALRDSPFSESAIERQNSLNFRLLIFRWKRASVRNNACNVCLSLPDVCPNQLVNELSLAPAMLAPTGRPNLTRIVSYGGYIDIRPSLANAPIAHADLNEGPPEQRAWFPKTDEPLDRVELSQNFDIRDADELALNQGSVKSGPGQAHGRVRAAIE